MKKFLSPQQFKLSKAYLAPQKEISESTEDETLGDMGKLQVPISDHSVGRATDEKSVNQPNDWRISLPLQNQSLVCRTFSLTKVSFQQGS